MKKIFLSTIIVLIFPLFSWSQTDDKYSDKIKIERDSLLNDLREKLLRNEEEIGILASNNSRNTRIIDVERMQQALETRIKTIEEAPKTKIRLNGMLALNELLGIQRDLKPAKLFNSSQQFFDALSNVSNLQSYPSFINWKNYYDKWYIEQKKDDQFLTVINNSLNIVENLSDKVSLSGPIVPTVTSGLGALISQFGKKHRELKDRTPEMLFVISAIGQVETQKAIIDNEWRQINLDLEMLNKENERILKDQLEYFDLKYDIFKEKYLNVVNETERDKYKEKCRDAFNKKIESLDLNMVSKSSWIGQIEFFMYKVQSLRIRFGNLTSRMLSNLERYEQLIDIYSDASKYPKELTSRMKDLDKHIEIVKINFHSSFNPKVYIEDSETMYIEKM